MGIFGNLFNQTYNTNQKMGKAKRTLQRAQAKVNPFYESAVQSGQNYTGLLNDYLGVNGADTQRAAYENYVTSPAFDFQFDRGVGALDASAAARGGLQSGAHMKDLQQFGQGLFAQDFSSYLDRLMRGQQVGFQGASGITSGAKDIANLKIAQGQSEDAGQNAALGNLLGIGGTLIGGFTGMPQGGSVLTQLFNNGRIGY